MVKVKVTKKPLVVARKKLNKVGKSVKLKTTAIATKTVSQMKKLKRKKEMRETHWKKLTHDRGVVYITHIPHGFYEKEMFEYFQQFGKVTGIRLPRSKNGKCKGFAFIEFQYKEIAKVVAETMNNYLMFDKLLKVQYIPHEKQKPHLFHRDSMPWEDSTHQEACTERRNCSRLAKNSSTISASAFVEKTDQKLKKMQNKILKKTGISYNFQIVDSNSECIQLLGAKHKTA